ncbi:translocation/assembly module TamB domain-containing protein [Roseivirga sp. BDSF3-8]|uniref:translocation/assembly module TamB domain-containing protein n=1 Tax=Roseivirga sp. BDSF3-8 TaxID=3241598 RepID=UPI0035324E3E
MVALSLLIFVLSVAALQSPWVQTKIVQQISENLTEKLGFPVSIKYVNIRWFDTILLEDVQVRDKQDNLMIGVDRLRVNFDYREMFADELHRIDEIRLYDAEVNMVRYPADSEININQFVRRVKELTKPKNPKKNPTYLYIDRVVFADSRFTMNDMLKDSIPEGFDYYHFTMEDLDIHGQEFNVRADTMAVDIKRMYAKERKTNTAINKLTTYFRFSESAMEFYNMNFSLGQSLLQDTLVFTYNESANLSYFNDSVRVLAKLDNSVIHTSDLALFAPSLKEFNQRYTVSGTVRGKVTNFTARNLELDFGRSSSLKGRLSFEGLPDVENTFIQAEVENSAINAADLEPYIKPDTYDRLQVFGRSYFNGRFTGFVNDFVANGNFRTPLGTIDSDINLKIRETGAASTYTGSLALTNFNLGRLTGRPEDVQRVTMSGTINGSGFSVEEADVEVDVEVAKLGLKGYNYRNIVTEAKLSNEFFEGNLSVDDPNMQFTGYASVDLRDDRNHIRINANLDTMRLHVLNLMEEELALHSQLDVDITGLDVDSITGSGFLRDTRIRYQGRSLNLDSLVFDSYREANYRELHVGSERMRVDARGQFDYRPLIKDLKRLLKEYQLAFENEQDALDAYYANLRDTTYADYQVEFSAQLDNANPLLQLLVPELEISRNTRLEGSFNGGYTSIVRLNTMVDTLAYKSNVWHNLQADITTSKIADSTAVLASGFVGAEMLELENVAALRDLSVEGIWDRDHIDFYAYAEQEGGENYANVSGELEFLTDSTVISFLDDTEFQVLEKVWRVSDRNRITLAGGDVVVQDLRVFNEDQRVAANGVLSDSVGDVFKLDVDNFLVENLNSLLEDTQVFGTFDGSIDVRGFFGERLLESNFILSRFRVGRFPVGRIIGNTVYEREQDRMRTTLNVNREGEEIIAVNGFYYPRREENSLELVANFDGANLNVVEPFVDDIFTEIQGKASGRFTISGTLSYPILRGRGDFRNGRAHFNYLNTDYTFNGGLIFDDNEIGVRNLELRDAGNNLALLTGGFFHDGFRDFVIDLHGEMENFRVLNTTAEDNELYYGMAHVTGSLDILGAPSNLNIDATAVTEPNTRLFIPVEMDEDLTDKSYVNYVDRSDSVIRATIEGELEAVDLRGIQMEFDLGITPDAYAEIIFDIKAGDIIRGRGNGDVKMLINTEGEFNMFGDFVFETGGYNFTLYNIINKEFEILPNSRISWYGDPYEGILDINALYRQRASLAPLLQVNDEEFYNQPEVIRRYPVELALELDGPLLQPDIGFDIDIGNVPDVVVTPAGPISFSDAIQAFSARIQNDEQELKRQVFSLLVLQRFSEQNSFSVGGETIGNSLSEFLSNQLSYWVTQFDDNLQIDVDLAGLDADAFNTFQLRLSYTFLEGRLRITRDGGFTNIQNEANLGSIAGDWTLEYLLTEDGRLRVKMYNRTDFSLVNEALDNASYTVAGVSLMHTQSWDTVKEIFTNTRKKALSDKLKELQEQPEDEDEEEPAEDPIIQATPVQEEEEPEGGV